MATSVARPTEPALNLAEVEPFLLGHATVDPGHRHISWDGDRREEVEPRVMKVLVTLAKAEGHVVSRDRLIHLCWDDRIVGDDAINRCVQSIRRLAKLIEPVPFRIETTARVGYSLLAEPVPARGFLAAALPRRRRQGRAASARSTRMLSFGAVTLALASAAAVVPRAGDSRMTRVAIMADTPADARLAADLKIDLNEFAGGTLTDLSLVGPSGKADFIVRVSTGRDGGAVHGNASLSEGRGKDLLWSASVEPGSGASGTVRGQLSAELGNLLACASKLTGRDGRDLDTAAKRLFLAACTHMDDIADQNDVDLLTKLTVTAPKFAAGWSYLALAEGELLTTGETLQGAVAADRGPDWQHAAAALRRAQALDGALGTNFVAAALLLPRSDWAGRLKTLEAGIARDPDEFLLYQGQSLMLGEVGFTQRSMEAAQRAADLKPFSVHARSARLWALVHSGEIALATAELAEAEKLWPNSGELDSVRFSIELRYGDARLAKRMIDSGKASLGGCDGMNLLMRARLAPTPANIAALVRYATVDLRDFPAAAPQRLLALAQFGATGEAYSVIGQPGSLKALRTAPDIFFRPQFRSLRQDPRFLQLAASLGLLKFWRDSGEWPDFCSDPRLGYDCQAEAARLLGPPQTGPQSIAAVAQPDAA